MPGIFRNTSEITLTIANGESLSQAFCIEGFSGMAVKTPASWTAANIGFVASATEGGTYVIVQKNNSDVSDSTPVQISGIDTTNSEWHTAPDEIFPYRWIKLFSKSATAATETAVNQSGAKTLVVILKA